MRPSVPPVLSSAGCRRRPARFLPRQSVQWKCPAPFLSRQSVQRHRPAVPAAPLSPRSPHPARSVFPAGPLQPAPVRPAAPVNAFDCCPAPAAFPPVLRLCLRAPLWISYTRDFLPFPEGGWEHRYNRSRNLCPRSSVSAVLPAFPAWRRFPQPDSCGIRHRRGPKRYLLQKSRCHRQNYIPEEWHRSLSDLSFASNKTAGNPRRKRK